MRPQRRARYVARGPSRFPGDFILMPQSAQTDTMPHVPVMLAEVLAHLRPAAGETYVDGTFGAGGYSRAILDFAACNVIAIDRDITAHERAAAWRDQYGERLCLVHDTFGNIATIVAGSADAPVQGVVLDIGVSSMQIDQAERGFSFRRDGPLDMRMDQGSGESAADIVNRMGEEDLADLIYKYGEERHSRRIARAIVSARAAAPVTRTGQLAEIVRGALPRARHDDIDPATRTFQALRIAVNDELGELERGLAGAEQVLAAGGRLVVVTFHSLEDRIVKNFMKDRAGDVPSPSRYLPVKQAEMEQTFTVVPRKAVTPGADEIRSNPRARSAKLRCAIRTDAPARQAEGGGR